MQGIQLDGLRGYYVGRQAEDVPTWSNQLMSRRIPQDMSVFFRL